MLQLATLVDFPKKLKSVSSRHFLFAEFDQTRFDRKAQAPEYLYSFDFPFLKLHTIQIIFNADL